MTDVQIEQFLSVMEMIHEDNKNKGFWDDYTTASQILLEPDSYSKLEVRLAANIIRLFPYERLMLIVTELSEAIHGHRKGLMDDKLPQFSMFNVEIADAQIRLLDLAGGIIPMLPYMMKAKLVYNKTRPYKHGDVQ